MPNHNFVFFYYLGQSFGELEMEMNLYVIDVSLKMDTT